MNVGWIAPIHKKCGISFYAEKYARALVSRCRIVDLDPDDFWRDERKFSAALLDCDCVHVQYETSLFLRGRTDFFTKLCRRIRVRKVVTLHELYKKIPGVFPREEIKGFGPVKALREAVWDMRHRHWAAFAKHQRERFYADALIVHSNFQKEILVERGFDGKKISVIPLPVEQRTAMKAVLDPDASEISLGATGFINPLYDYDRLFEVLYNIRSPWRFVWVGGARRKDDEGLLGRIVREVDKRGWSKRFTITGWVPDEERDRLLDEMQVFCAFFKDRSSSESLADAIGAKKLIIASRIPLTEELAGFGPVLVLAPVEPEKIARTISAMILDKELLLKIEKAQARYGETYSPANCAKCVVDLYEKITNSRSTASTSA